MAAQTKLYYRQAAAAIRNGELAPAYFLYGEEVYLIDALITAISKKFLGKIDKEMNYYIRYAQDASLDDILALLAGGGLFSDKKMVVLKDYQNMRNPNPEKLIKYLKKPDHNNCLVIVAGVDNISQAKYKNIAQQSVTVNLLPLRENELNEFVRSEFEKYDKSVSRDAINTILYLVGEKINDLRTEIAQVANFFKDKKEIGPGEIEKVVGVYVNQNVFELTQAIARKQMDRSLFILKNLLEKGESPGTIQFLLLRHIMMLWKIRGFYQSGIREERKIQEKLKIYPRQFKEYIRELSNWQLKHLNKAIQLIHESDKALKSGNAKPEIIMDLLLMKLIELK